MHINWKKEILTIPNLLSVFRLALIPVYITIYLKAVEPCDYYLAAGILALSCMTDMIDGYIARRFNMISNMGKFLDPIADKMTQFTLIVCLAFRYPILIWLICLFVVKESFQLIAMLVNLRRGKALNGALMEGKICTTVLFISLIFLVNGLGLLLGIGWTLYIVVALVLIAVIYAVASSIAIEKRKATKA